MAPHLTPRSFALLALLLRAGPLRAADLTGQVVGAAIPDAAGTARTAPFARRRPRPRDDALALLLAFGSASTGGRDGRPTRCGPGPAPFKFTNASKASAAPLLCVRVERKVRS